MQKQENKTKQRKDADFKCPIPEQVEQRFWHLHGTLKPQVQEKLRIYWNNKNPIIATRKEDIDDFARILGPITIAATDGYVFFFRLESIDEWMLDRVILHEIAHAYIFARDGTEMHNYQNAVLRDRNEREVNYLSEEWLAHVRHKV